MKKMKQNLLLLLFIISSFNFLKISCSELKQLEKAHEVLNFKKTVDSINFDMFLGAMVNRDKARLDDVFESSLFNPNEVDEKGNPLLWYAISFYQKYRHPN